MLKFYVEVAVLWISDLRVICCHHFVVYSTCGNEEAGNQTGLGLDLVDIPIAPLRVVVRSSVLETNSYDSRQ